jgi:replicative DNA helicase
MEDKLAKLHSKDAEKCIIAEILNNDESIANIQNLKPKHFFNRHFKRLYKKILKLAKANKPVDLVTLSNELEGVKVSDLTHFIGESISPIKIKEYEQLIINNWIRRELLKSGNSFITEILKPGVVPSDVITKISGKFDKILKSDTEIKKLGEIETALMDLINQRVDGIRKNPGIRTGYIGIDTKTGGFQPSDLITIGGDTSAGKTALSLNIVENLIFKNDPEPIGYISLELSKTGLLDRLISTRAEINIQDFYNDEITDQDRDKYFKVANLLQNKPLWVVDNISTLPEIETKINLLYKNYKTRIIFIDNLQNLLGNAGQDFRKLISEATRTLKSTAKKLNIIIVVLSHLSRAKEEKTPRLSDLKESSSIEQDSDKVILIHRPYKDALTDDVDEQVSLNLAKNRQGHTGKIDLNFNRKIARFENKAQDKHPGF